MKNLIKFLIIIMTMTSCTDGFLDKNPLDQVSSEVFWNSKDEVDMALAGVYRRLQANFLGYHRIYLDCMADNGYADNQFGIHNLSLGNLFPTSGGAINNLYNAPYQGISSANFFLDNIDRAPLSENEANHYKAEIRFLRAFFYLDLVQSFGGVVVYKTLPIGNEEINVKQSPQEEVLDFITEDLDFAIDHLPNTQYSDGHAVKGSALTMKARVLLFRNRFTEAIPVLEEVINSGQYRISDNYRGLFLTAHQSGNPEIIFSTRYLSPNNFQANNRGTDIEFGWWALVQPYQEMVDQYGCIDGLSITESPLYNSDSPFENRDPRLDMTMKLPGEEWIDQNGNRVDTYVSRTGYVLEKHVELDHAPFSQSMANKTDHDFVHMRYADVLLMYAEALNEVEGPNEIAFQTLDQIRGRNGVDLPPLDRAKFNSQDQMRDLIRKERRIELAFEGHRYFDLKRWNIAHVVIPAAKNPAGVNLGFDLHHYRLPFQQQELDLNPNLEQNTGY